MSSYTFINWFGKIPSNWQLSPLKMITKGFVSDGPHETPIFYDNGVPFLSIDSIQDNKLVFENTRFISEEDHLRYSNKCKPRKNDVLLGKAASVGKVAFVDTDIEFNVWSPLAVIRPPCEALGKFIYYSFQSLPVQSQCTVKSNTNTQNNLGMGDINNLILPDVDEKTAANIVYYLDFETNKIDSLISEKQVFINLLKEKRQALISHFVTKGLDPNVPMKDSGVEWIGEVPENWGVPKIAYIYPTLGSGTTPKSDNEDYYGGHTHWVTTGELREAEITATKKTVSDLALAEHSALKKHQPDSVVMAMYGATIGRVGILKIEATTNQACCVFPPSSRMLSGFLYFWLMGYREEIVNLGYGGGQPNISMGTVSALKIPTPSISEQELILERIQKETLTLNELLSETEKSIELLHEHRTALISAAVTGKIDVRGMVDAKGDSV